MSLNPLFRIAALVAIVAALCMSLYAMLATAAPESTSVLTASTIKVDKRVAETDEFLTYHITLNNPSNEAELVSLVSELPNQLGLVPNSTTASTRSSGIELSRFANKVLWSGTLAPNESVVVSYQAYIHGTRARVGSTIANEVYVIIGDIGTSLRSETEIVAQSDTAGRNVNRDFSTSTKSVSPEIAMPEDALTYTIVMSNTGDQALATTLSDALPDELTYVPDSLSATGGMTTSFGFDTDNSTITWTGTITTSAAATVTFSAEVAASGFISGDIVTNEASILAGSGIVQVSAETTIQLVPFGPTRISYLSNLYKLLNPPSIFVSAKPNSANQRTIGWASEGSTVSYEVQVDDNPEFSSPTEINVSSTNYTHTPAASFNNILYYRVRAVAQNNQRSDWSNTVSVIGAYYDEFNSNTTGWDLQRMTLLGEVRAFYEPASSWYVIQIDDQWDWGIASPMRPAPALPYAVEMRVQAVTDGNLISFGAVTHGDHVNTDEPCIDYSTIFGLYQNDNCFNHFYNANFINKAAGTDLKMLWEKVDFLFWCIDGQGNNVCGGGSPMKRLSEDVKQWIEVNSVPNTNKDQNAPWNVWRIEVYEDRQVIFSNGTPYATFTNSEFSNDPYWGIFASTDEYNNSTWRVDWVKVTPIDQ